MSEVTSTADLGSNFTKETIDIVKDLLAKGATIRRTKAGHLQVRSSVNSQTMSLSQNSGRGGKSLDLARADVRRLYPEGEETLSKSDFPGGWDKDIKDVCLKAVNEFGWTFSWASTGNGRFITITAPDGSNKSMKFNSGSKPINPNVQAMRRSILQHGTLRDEAVSAAVGIALGKEQPDAPRHQSVGDPNTVLTPPRPLPPSPINMEIMIIPDDEMDRENNRWVEHKRPWMAKRSDTTRGDKKYESHAVIEREWSDGYMDYVCSDPDCKHPPQVKPRSVSAHYASQHARGKGKRDQPSSTQLLVTTEKTEPSYHKEYSPREDRVLALAEWLEEHVGDGDIKDVARGLLIWQHNQSGEGSNEPLTAEQVLDQIRRLVDHGEYMRQRTRIEELESEMFKALEAVEAANVNADSCKKRADDLEEHLSTVRELLSFGGAKDES